MEPGPVKSWLGSGHVSQPGGFSLDITLCACDRVGPQVRTPMVYTPLFLQKSKSTPSLWCLFGLLTAPCPPRNLQSPSPSPASPLGRQPFLICPCLALAQTQSLPCSPWAGTADFNLHLQASPVLEGRQRHPKAQYLVEVTALKGSSLWMPACFSLKKPIKDFVTNFFP